MTVRVRPSVRAWATFLLALWRSLQMVPRETPISVPACCWDKPSRSTSLSASISAGSIVMGLAGVVGCGVNCSTREGVGIVTGLGNLPLLPRRHRLRDIVICLLVCAVTFIYFCALSSKCKLCINTKIEVKQKKCQEETKQDHTAQDP